MAEEKEATKEKKTRSLTTPILVVLAVIVAFLGGMFLTRGLSGRGGETPEKVAQINPSPEEGAVLGELIKTIGNFSITQEEICLENGKPLIYFFGSTSCPYCAWEHPIVEKVTAKFTGLISPRLYMDDFETDKQVLDKYEEIHGGYVPFLVFGCHYVQLGSGKSFGEEEEENYLTAIICKLTEGKPEAVCATVKELTDQIEE